MNIRYRFCRQLRESGDTLIEVTMALAILSVVLLSTTVVTTRAFQTGQVARERTSLVNEAQDQMEALRSFRDSNTWDHFLYGDSTPPAYKGVLTANTSTDCKVTAPCWHMEMSGSVSPKEGLVHGKVPTSWIEIAVTPDGALPLRYVEVALSYGADSLGGTPDIKGHINTKFTDLGYAAPPPPPCTAVNDIVLVLDASSSMGSAWIDPVTGPTTRRTKAIATSHIFVDNLVIAPDKNNLGIVRFNSSATQLSPLSSNVPALHTALNGYGTAPGTRITNGLEAARQMLLTSPRATAPKVVVLISDGIPGLPDTVALVNAKANQMTDVDGIRIYTVYIGDDDAAQALPLMNNIAGGGGLPGNATYPGELDSIMGAIILAEACV